jgi:hypothetical protein
MKYIIIFALLLLPAIGMPADSLQVTVRPGKKDVLVGLQIWVEVEVQNTSSRPIEVPDVLTACIRDAGGMCKNMLTKKDGKAPSSKEFLYSFSMEDRAMTPLKTEILQPGERRAKRLMLGEGLVPLELTYQVICTFYEDPKTYEKNLYKLDHAIVSGTFSSNIAPIQIEQPTDLDEEIYNKYWRDRAARAKMEDSRTKEFWQLLTEYPRSAYAERQICHSDPSDAMQAFQVKRPEEFVAGALRNKSWNSTNADRMKELKEQNEYAMASMNILQRHPQSICSFSMRLFCAERFIDNGAFNWACRSLNEILTMTPAREVDAVISAKAKEYLDALRTNGYCK